MVKQNVDRKTSELSYIIRRKVYNVYQDGVRKLPDGSPGPLPTYNVVKKLDESNHL